MQSLPVHTNVVLIGMPAAGKSTIGVLLAKVMARPFIDIDLLIQTRARATLQHLLNTLGPDGFCDLEESEVLGLSARGSVIATGGSVVYRPDGMRHLRSHGYVLYLQVKLETVMMRLTDMDRRGVVLPLRRTLPDLYKEREPLYRRYAHGCIACDGLDHNQTVSAILLDLKRSGLAP